MSPAVIAGLVWLLTANVAAMVPSKDNHWSRAYALIAVGLPILGWIFWTQGIWLALIFLAAAMSVLRWPVRYLIRWARGVLGR